MQKCLLLFVGIRVAKLFCYSGVVVIAFAVMAGVAGGGTAVFHNAEQGQHLSAANAKFAIDLYKRQTSATDQNIFMSPLSISVALAMTYLGARGQTKSQMRDVLHFTDVTEDNLHEAFTDIQSALNKPHEAYKLYMANRLFGEKSYRFLEEFVAAGRKHYAAELAPVDFRYSDVSLLTSSKIHCHYMSHSFISYQVGSVSRIQMFCNVLHFCTKTV